MQLSKKQIIWAIIIISIGAIFFFLSNKKEEVTQNTATVKRGDVVQEVSVTGRVKAVSSVDLGFEKSGRIQNVYVDVGDRVKQGALLAEIESSSAQATLKETEARLAELKRGSRPEEIAVKEAELAKYTQDLTNAYSGIPDIIDDAFTKTDDALHSKIAGTFSGFKTSSYKLTFPVCDTQLDVNTTWLRYTTELDFDNWRNERSSFSSTGSQSELKSALDNTTLHLEQMRTFLESLNRVLTLDCTIASPNLDTYRTNINTARANITTAAATVNTKGQSIASLALSVAKVQDELSLLKAGTATEVIDAQEARLLSAHGELRKHKIYSPISGTVTKVDATTGEFANAATPLISVISDNSFEIDANIPEADIAKVTIGNKARITLDAYGSDTFFDGHVININPAETIIDNVPTYKVTFVFEKNDPRIKSGMTANIDIATASRTSVLIVPTRAIITKDGNKLVTVINADNTETETHVTIGLRGSDGFAEILDGVSLGTQILTSTK